MREVRLCECAAAEVGGGVLPGALCLADVDGDGEDEGATALGSDEYGTTIRQARGVMWACAALLFLAVAVELMRFGG